MTEAELLEQLGRSRDLGFLGDGPVEQHVEHSSVLLGAIAALSIVEAESGSRLLDLGSGGGVPGLVAVFDGRWSSVDLLDRSERRCAFLRSAVAAVAAAGTTRVLSGSAEILGHDPAVREAYDAVISRGFGPPSATLECASGFVAVGGFVVVSDPPHGRAWPALIEPLELELVEARSIAPAYSMFRKLRALSDRYPRREGVPARRPLFDAPGR